APQKDYSFAPLTNAIENLEEAYCSHQEQTDRSQKSQFRWQKATCAFTGLAFVAAAVYAEITFCQWQDLKSNFAVDQRAWVGITDIIPVELVESGNDFSF